MVVANVQFDVDGRFILMGRKRPIGSRWTKTHVDWNLEHSRWWDGFNRGTSTSISLAGRSHNGSIGNTEYILKSNQWEPKVNYGQLLSSTSPSLQLPSQLPNQSPHAPGITAWIFPQPKWWSSTSWRLCTIGSWWPLMLSVRSWKPHSFWTARKSWNPWSLPTTSRLGPGENKQTQSRSEGRIFKADSQSPLKKKQLSSWGENVWNGWQSGIKLSVSDLPHICFFFHVAQSMMHLIGGWLLWPPRVQLKPSQWRAWAGPWYPGKK